jgi:hypothetical protein
MKTIAKFCSIVLLLIIGFGIGYFTRSRQGQFESTVEDAWLFNGVVPLKGAISYHSDAVLNSDIPLPEIEAIESKIKLIAPPSGDSQRTRVIAYVTQVRVASLERRNIPAKYLRERVEQYKGSPLTTLPLEQVTYAVQFTFDLVDKDGFKLAEVTGPKQWLESGKSNMFQEITTQPLDPDLVRRTATLRTHLTVLRCESCRAG